MTETVEQMQSRLREKQAERDAAEEEIAALERKIAAARRGDQQLTGTCEGNGLVIVDL